MGAVEHWEAEAARWAAWARAPGHDAYWHYRDAFFALVPPPGRAILEVGCGEGRVARDLAARGHRVTGIDITRALVSLAAEADAGPRYLLADGAAPPFESATFDLVVAYNSLMDVGGPHDPDPRRQPDRYHPQSGGHVADARRGRRDDRGWALGPAAGDQP